MNSRNVLLVEDNEINQHLVTEILTRANYKVTVANNGREALNLLDQHEFFVVLMDLRMPVMDGYETVSLIRQKPELRDLPVVAVSAVVQQTEVNRALTSGFDYHIPKPIEFNTLYSLLDTIYQGVSESPVNRSSNPGDQTPGNSSDISLNLESAMQRHAQDESLLVRLLNEFIKHYESVDTDIALKISSNEFEEAERLAHNIKGVAGSFGAEPLAECAKALEQSLKESKGNYQQLLAHFSVELKNFLTSARTLLEKQQ